MREAHIINKTKQLVIKFKKYCRLSGTIIRKNSKFILVNKRDILGNL